MATIYLDSVTGDDVDSGADWDNAKATLQAAVTAAGVGGTVYASHAHAESIAATTTLTLPSTQPDSYQSLLRILSVNKATGALTEGAAYGVTGASTLSINGSAFFHGWKISTAAVNRNVNFNISTTDTTGELVLEDCTIGGGAFVLLSGSVRHGGTRATIINTRLLAGFTTTAWSVAGVIEVEFKNIPDAIINGGQATVVDFIDFTSTSTGQRLVTLRNCGLQNVTDAIFSQGASNLMAVCKLQDCRLRSGCVVSDIDSIPGSSIEMVNCDTSATNYRYYYEDYRGKIYQESTIVRTGGASDGTTAISRKLVSSAYSEFFRPLELACNTWWNEDLTEQTATVHIVTDNVTLTNGECWLEIEYLGSADYPVANKLGDAMTNILATPANQTASTETWTTTGLTTPVKQQLAVTFTAAMKGPVRARVMLAKPSTTVYVCPKVEIS